jgi:hypothetical protein
VEEAVWNLEGQNASSPFIRAQPKHPSLPGAEAPLGRVSPRAAIPQNVAVVGQQQQRVDQSINTSFEIQRTD